MSRIASIVALSLAAATAHAQSGTGTCNGMMTGTATLAIANGRGGWHRLDPTEVPSFFGRAECACDTQDVALEIDLTSALPPATSGVAEIWVGDSSCLNATTRTSATNTTCEKLATVSVQDFTVNATQPPHYPLPSRALFAPFKHACDVALLASNSVWLFVYSDINQPYATCTLSLTEEQRPPNAPSSLTATWQRDVSVLLSWTPPADQPLAPAIAGYDILCTRDDGVVEGSRDNAHFSLCTPDGIVRRTLGVDDGLLVSNGPRVGADPFAPPHPDAVCARAAADATSAFVEGLSPSSPHRFAVVAVDAFGNATASAVTRLAPAPPIYQPAPHGGCSLAGRASATPPLVVVVALAFAFVGLPSLRRRRARRS